MPLHCCDVCKAELRGVSQDGLCDQCRRKAKRARAAERRIVPRCSGCGAKLYGKYKLTLRCSKCTRGEIGRQRRVESSGIALGHIADRIELYATRIQRLTSNDPEVRQYAVPLFHGFERDPKIERGLEDVPELPNP